VYGTIVDHAGPVSPHGSRTLALASLSRELSANDWTERSDARRGDVTDRNVELLLPDPLSARHRHGAPVSAMAAV